MMFVGVLRGSELCLKRLNRMVSVFQYAIVRAQKYEVFGTMVLNF